MSRHGCKVHGWRIYGLCPGNHMTSICRAALSTLGSIDIWSIMRLEGLCWLLTNKVLHSLPTAVFRQTITFLLQDTLIPSMQPKSKLVSLLVLLQTYL